MPRLSIITPCDPARAQFLDAASASIDQARSAIELEWIVVFDGPPLGVFGLGDVQIAHAHQRGVSAARNTALAAASGEFIAPLDADDLIVADGLLSAIEQFDAGEELGWVAANRVDLATGSPTKHWHGEQDWAAGSLVSASAGPLPFHPNSIVARRELAERIGGWRPGRDFGEDMLFALECSELAPGRSVSSVMHEYRTWPGQTTASADYVDAYGTTSESILRHINRMRRQLGRAEV